MGPFQYNLYSTLHSRQVHSALSLPGQESSCIHSNNCELFPQLLGKKVPLSVNLTKNTMLFIVYLYFTVCLINPNQATIDQLTTPLYCLKPWRVQHRWTFLRYLPTQRTNSACHFFYLLKNVRPLPDLQTLSPPKHASQPWCSRKIPEAYCTHPVQSVNHVHSQRLQIPTAPRSTSTCVDSMTDGLL